jgi:hypothetical protein
MNAVVKIENHDVNVVEYKNLPVLTTEQLANFYGTDQNNIQKNYSRNSERFTEGKHFFKVEGEELRKLKATLTDSRSVGSKDITDNIGYVQISKNASSIILWTEKGAARHAKILDTDQAWEVFEKLEDCYFAVKEMTQPKTTKEKPMQLGTITRQCAMMARAFGFKGNQHILATDKAVKALTGQSPLELLGETHLIAENKQQILTPTQLGEMCEPKLSARKVNEVLLNLGYQERVGGIWAVTTKGEKLCEMLDTGKKHNDGTPIKQVKWYQAVMDDIKQALLNGVVV